MHPDAITYRGSYCYRDRATLDRAMARVRDELADDDLEPTEWLRALVATGTRLDIDLVIGSGSERRFVAANVLLILAQGALTGAVEARQRERTLDLYSPDDE
jgi:hypothetical protein